MFCGTIYIINFINTLSGYFSWLAQNCSSQKKHSFKCIFPSVLLGCNWNGWYGVTEVMKKYARKIVTFFRFLLLISTKIIQYEWTWRKYICILDKLKSFEINKSKNFYIFIHCWKLIFFRWKLYFRKSSNDPFLCFDIYFLTK